MSITAKSVIFDIADTYGAVSPSDYMGIRSIEFSIGGSVISLTTGFVAYATSTFSGYDPKWTFDTSKSKTGSWSGNEWVSAYSGNFNQRLIIVFDSPLTFDSLIVNNGHTLGGYTANGAKTVSIHSSSDTITNTTYAASITNSTELFTGDFNRHVSSDVEDPQTIAIGANALTLTGSGGGVAGGTSPVIFPVSVTKSVSGGAVVGGHAIDSINPYGNPTRFYKCESLASGVSPDFISGGEGLQCNSATVISGKFGNALSIAASAYAAYLLPNIGNTQFETVSWRFQRKNTTQASGLLKNYSGSKILYITASGTLMVRNSPTDISSGGTVSDTAWHNLIFAKGSTSSKVTLTLDNVLLGTEFDSDWSAGMFEFAVSSSLCPHNCNIDNVQIYNRLLSSEEKSYLFNQTVEELPFPMAIAGNGGAVVGGHAVSVYPLIFTGAAGAVVRGSADIVLVSLTPPTQQWTFDRTSGSTVLNEISGGNTLDLNTHTLATGKFGNAAGNVSTAVPAIVSDNTPFKSISLWIKRNLSGVSEILSSSNTEYETLEFWAQPELVFKQHLTWQYSGLTITDVAWHHICIVEGSDPQHHYIYLDTVRSSNELFSDFQDFRYLARNYVSIDAVQVYDRILTQEEVTYLYNAISDLTTLPRLPSLIVSPSAGGAVIGGAADVEERSLTVYKAADGGAVVGGHADILNLFLHISGSCPRYRGDSELITTTVVFVYGYHPKYRGSIGSGVDIIGRHPKYRGSVTTQHTVLAGIGGQCPRYRGSSESVTTFITSFSGHAPQYRGSSELFVSDLLSVSVSCPPYRGTAEAVMTCLLDVSAHHPRYQGTVRAENQNSVDETLHFEPHVVNFVPATVYLAPQYHCDIQVDSGEPEKILAFVR